MRHGAGARYSSRSSLNWKTSWIFGTTIKIFLIPAEPGGRKIFCARPGNHQRLAGSSSGRPRRRLPCGKEPRNQFGLVVPVLVLRIRNREKLRRSEVPGGRASTVSPAPNLSRTGYRRTLHLPQERPGQAGPRYCPKRRNSIDETIRHPSGGRTSPPDSRHGSTPSTNRTPSWSRLRNSILALVIFLYLKLSIRRYNITPTEILP